MFQRLLLLLLTLAVTPGKPYDDYLLGNAADVSVPCQGGYALMGGAADPLEEGFRWLIERASGGDALVLAQSGDYYNAFLKRLGPLDSVETLVINQREAAFDPAVIRKVDEAEIIFFGGGDQSRYITRWKGTPLEDALNRAVARGVAMGGTSAGLAILGQYSFSAMHDTVTSEQALADPFDARVTLENDFLKIPVLKGILTDSHFSQRTRMGRLGVFLARLAGEKVRGIGVDETTALLVEPDGSCHREGLGSVYLVTLAGGECTPGTPVRNLKLDTIRLSEPGQHFDLARWQGDGERETLSF